MSKLIIEGEDLTMAKNVIRALGGYKIREQIADEQEPAARKPIVGTCSSCPWFTEVVDPRGQTRVKWGKCERFGGSAISREHKYCNSYSEEANYKREAV